MVDAASRVQVVFRNGRSCCNQTCCAQGGSSDSRYALGDEISLRVEMFGESVEQLVQLEEFGALYVPVCLFGLCLQVDGVGEPRVQDIDALVAGGFREVDAGRKGASRGLCGHDLSLTPY